MSYRCNLCYKFILYNEKIEKEITLLEMNIKMDKNTTREKLLDTLKCINQILENLQADVKSSSYNNITCNVSSLNKSISEFIHELKEF